MGLFDRVEAKLERAVNGAFARAFKADVQPVEIASAIRRAMDDRATTYGPGQVTCPNVFQVELSPADYQRLAPYGEDISEELIAAAAEHAESQRYAVNGPFQMFLTQADDLETGVFRVRPAKARHRATPQVPQSRSARHADHGGYAAPAGPPPAAQAPPQMPAAAPRPHHDDLEEGDTYAPAPAVGPSTGAAHAGSHAAGAAPAGPPQHAPALDPDIDVESAPAPPPALEPEPVHQRRRTVDPSERPWLEIDRERYPLLGALTVLGRDEGVDIILADPGISRRHCEVRITTDGPRRVVTLRDLRSTNGTFVNGERITSAHLDDGDQITIGRTSLTYHGGR